VPSAVKDVHRGIDKVDDTDCAQIVGGNLCLEAKSVFRPGLVVDDCPAGHLVPKLKAVPPMNAVCRK
jgi:hypothetical protein